MDNPYPIICKYVRTYSEYENLKVKLIIGEDSEISKSFLLDSHKNSNSNFEFIDGTLLNISDPFKRNILKERLSFKINENTKIAVNDKIDLKILPINPIHYLIDSNIKDGTIYVTPKLGESNINELIQNNYKYRFNKATNSFDLVSKNEYVKYFFRHKIKERILSEYGDESDRIADLSELILRLANHLNSIKEIEDTRLIDLLDKELEIKSRVLNISSRF